jgi:hypothetical protein
MIFEIQRNGKVAPKLVKTSSLTDEGWSEKDLENYLRENLPELISDDLMVIGQSRPYQPEADLLALDRHGDLWIFELKKVSTSSDNLLQVPQQLRQRLRLVLLFWRRQQLQQRWQVQRRRQFKAALVACRFVSLVHACSGGVPYTGARGC